MRASCVMPTCGRVEFTKKAIEYFLRQTETDSELIIVDDWDMPTFDAYAKYCDDIEPRIKVYRVSTRHAREPLPAGSKRNIGTKHAKGDFIVQWDDDDWYAPTRIERQLERLSQPKVDLSWMPRTTLLNINSWEWFTPKTDSYWFKGSLVVGASLAYRREVWDAGVRYADTTYGDEEGFCKLARESGFKRERSPDEEQWLYIRHNQHIVDGKLKTRLAGPGLVSLEPADVPEYIGDEDLLFYSRMRRLLQPQVPLL